MNALQKIPDIQVIGNYLLDEIVYWVGVKEESIIMKDEYSASCKTICVGEILVDVETGQTEMTFSDTTSQKPRFWTDNFKTHDSQICDCDVCKGYRI